LDVEEEFSGESQPRCCDSCICREHLPQMAYKSRITKWTIIASP
jgi:hypothetical protein